MKIQKNQEQESSLHFRTSNESNRMPDVLDDVKGLHESPEGLAVIGRDLGLRIQTPSLTQQPSGKRNVLLLGFRSQSSLFLNKSEITFAGKMRLHIWNGFVESSSCTKERARSLTLW